MAVTTATMNVAPTPTTQKSPDVARLLNPLAGSGAVPAARSAARLLSAVTLAMAAATLLAWILPGLSHDTVAGLRAMKANTALALTCISIAIWLGSRRTPSPRARYLARALSLLTVGIGVATLAEYVLAVDVGIDQLLASDRPGATYPGRMGSNTAVALALIGLATSLRDRPLAHRIGEAATVIAALIAVLAVVGFVFGVTTLNTVENHTQMAPQTALAVLCACGAILLSRPERGLAAILVSEGSGGFMARRLIPVSFLVPLAGGWLTSAGAHAGLYTPELGASINQVVAIVIVMTVVLMSARTLNRIDRQRQLGEERVLDLNQRLVQHTHELEDANRELESFSYSVSHDLRAPIRHIGGFAELLEQRAGALDEQGRHYVQTISESAKRAGNLIDDLLAFSRMSRAEMKREPVEMGRCVSDVWRELAPDREGRDLELVVPTLPRVIGDRTLLRLAVQNLLSNAIKYTRTRAQARIEIGARTDGAETTFFVKDNGVGFDMRYVGKLFGVFQRLHGAREFEGVGIGLANVKRIIQRHGGRVWAEGVVDEGATFFFTLPAGETS